jgi:hypothetical protein
MARMIPAFPTLPQTVDERSVDLECLEREALEIAQGRVPHPEIVETELHAERPQLVERLEDGVGMLETTPSVISSLRRAGSRPVAAEDRGDVTNQLRFEALPCGEIHVHDEARRFGKLLAPPRS